MFLSFVGFVTLQPCEFKSALKKGIKKRVLGRFFFHIKEDVMCRAGRNEKDKKAREAEKGKSPKGGKEHNMEYSFAYDYNRDVFICDVQV